MSSFPQLSLLEFSEDNSFERHVLGRLVLHGAFEASRVKGPLSGSLGLDNEELGCLLEFLHLNGVYSSVFQDNLIETDDEEIMLRQLLLHNLHKSDRVGVWFSSIVARRSMEPNHLWEDLGLARRPDLTQLLMRHFPFLACKNTRNMRWKRFLYRSLCEAEGFSMCPSPTCDSCSEFNVCYGDNSGEAVMARNQKSTHLAEALNDKDSIV